MSCDRIRLAIIGGGRAGAALVNALAYHPLLEIHVFESAAVLSERGAAVGLEANTQSALRHILSASDTTTLGDMVRRT